MLLNNNNTLRTYFKTDTYLRFSSTFLAKNMNNMKLSKEPL